MFVATWPILSVSVAPGERSADWLHVSSEPPGKRLVTRVPVFLSVASDERLVARLSVLSAAPGECLVARRPGSA